MTIKLHYQYLIKIKLLIVAIKLPIACAFVVTAGFFHYQEISNLVPL